MPDIILPTVFSNPSLRKAYDVLVADDFNRPDATVLGTTPIGGQAWEILSSMAAGAAQSRITSQQAGLGSTAAGRAFAVVNAGSPDAIMRMTYKTGLTNPNLYLVARAADINNAINIAGNGNNKWCVWRRIGGVGTQLVETAKSIMPNDRLEVSLRGPRLVLLVNGRVEADLDVSAPAIDGATKFGFGMTLSVPSATPQTWWDDFHLIRPASWS